MNIKKKLTTMLLSTIAIIGIFVLSSTTVSAGETGWIYSNGNWYYIDMQTNTKTKGWLYESNHWYYLNQDGVMVTGWVKEGGSWYYLRPSGVMATGWVYSNGNWYYLTSSGSMATGWVYSNGNWYYLHPSGAMASSQWVGHYYVGASGAMYQNRVTPDGYYVDASGKWVPNAIIGPKLPEYSQEEAESDNLFKQAEKEEGVTVEQAFSMTEETRYAKAKKYQDEFIREITAEEYQQVNQKLDIKKMNEYFIGLLNEERAKLGRKPVSYDPDLQIGATIRSKETTSRPRASLKHYRLDGSDYKLAAGQRVRDKYWWILENLQHTSRANIYEITSEKFIAEDSFIGWKESSGHYKSMIDERVTAVALGIYFDVEPEFNMKVGVTTLWMGLQK